MMEVFVGKKVRIRKDLEVEKMYGGIMVTESMAKHLGKECTITDFTQTSVSLDVDKVKWNWSREMLEEIEEDVKMNLFVGKKLRIRSVEELKALAEAGESILSIVTEMYDYAGKEAKIIDIDESDDTFNLDVDNDSWWWCADFVEEVVEQPQNDVVEESVQPTGEKVELYVNIVGANHFQGWEIFKLGREFSLVRDYNNAFDTEAIKVMRSGEHYGHVANSVKTMVMGCNSAGYIAGLIDNGLLLDTLKCKVMFINDSVVIAKVEV